MTCICISYHNRIVKYCLQHQYTRIFIFYVTPNLFGTISDYQIYQLFKSVGMIKKLLFKTTLKSIRFDSKIKIKKQPTILFYSLAFPLYSSHNFIKLTLFFKGSANI